MLYYVDAYVDHTIKNSYMILTESGAIVVRYDCYFRHSTPFPSLLNAQVYVILPRSLEKFQSILMTCSSTSERTITPQTETIYNRQVTMLSTVRYHFNPQYCATHGFSKTFTTKRGRSFL
jgi:hypothetical protein